MFVLDLNGFAGDPSGSCRFSDGVKGLRNMLQYVPL
jgi:hypothetical protein